VLDSSISTWGEGMDNCMSFWRLYYHLVWGTKNRQPTLDPEISVVAEKSIRDTANDLGLIFYSIGFMPEHVHLVVGIPPRHSISDVVKQIKGSSSHLLTTVAKNSSELAWHGWQGKYGVMSFGERSLDQIVRYVQNQKDHHLTGELLPALGKLGTELRDAHPERGNLGEVS